MKGASRALFVVLALFFLASASAAAQTAEAQKAYKAGNYEQSVSLCLQSLKANPNDIDAYAILGWSYLKQGNWDGAYTYGAKASVVQRYDHRITEIRGRAAYSLGRNEEALKFFQELITLMPEDTGSGPVFSLIGEIYIRLGQYAHADIALTAAVNYLPTDALLWSRLGYAREAASDYAYAREAYSAALKLNPSLKDAKLGLERVDAKLGR
jgi:tetratricopeptide (TPR) repeat protein